MSAAYQRGLGWAMRAGAADPACSAPSGGVQTDFLRTLDLGTYLLPPGAGCVVPGRDGPPA